MPMFTWLTVLLNADSMGRHHHRKTRQDVRSEQEHDRHEEAMAEIAQHIDVIGEYSNVQINKQNNRAKTAGAAFKMIDDLGADAASVFGGKGKTGASMPPPPPPPPTGLIMGLPIPALIIGAIALIFLLKK